MRYTSIAVMCLLACGGGNGITPPPVERGSVQGRVTDETETGLENVTVTLQPVCVSAGCAPRPEHSTSTSADGTYTFSRVEVGAWGATALLPRGFWASGPLSHRVEVTANQTVQVPVIKMWEPHPDAALNISIHSEGAFIPWYAEIWVGQKIRWRNEDSEIHNVNVRRNGGSWTSPDLNPHGVPYVHTFATAGLFEVKCTLHDHTRTIFGTMTVVVR
jgi:plastocyanin